MLNGRIGLNDHVALCKGTGSRWRRIRAKAPGGSAANKRLRTEDWDNLDIERRHIVGPRPSRPRRY